MAGLREFWVSRHAGLGGWLLEDSASVEHFTNEAEALSVAKDRARLAFAAWKDAQVHVRGPEGDWRTTLKLGDAPSRFPPD